VSTLKVTIEKLTVHPHPNADALELAQVGEYRAVVPKGQYKTGEHALYIPEQAVLPEELIEELGLVGRLAGKAANRVKAVRLRGEISQGIVCRPKALETMFDPEYELSTADFAEDLGIKKWAPEIPAHMNGAIEPAPDLIRWIDIENLQRYPDVFAFGEHVIATEKIHGTALLATYDVATERLWVSSKGHGSRNCALTQSESNLYWRAAVSHDLETKLAYIAEQLEATRVAVFGEVFGAGVQDLTYGANAGVDDQIGFRAFDVKLENSDSSSWVPALAFHRFCANFGLLPVPMVYDGPFDLAALTEAASGTTKIGGGNIREGVVIRPAAEGYSQRLGGRKIAKLVSPAYLLRKGNVTEYE
jgi:RNA ligase (TIGR02306 family)